MVVLLVWVLFFCVGSGVSAIAGVGAIIGVRAGVGVGTGASAGARCS